MVAFNQINKPTKLEQKVAIESFATLSLVLPQLKGENVSIKIEELEKTIQVPLKALEILEEVLKSMSEGKPISIAAIGTEITTQKAAEILGCSRPYLVKILEEGKIPFTKIGRHRRLLLEDVLKYKDHLRQESRKHIVEIMKFDEEIGLYDS